MAVDARAFAKAWVEAWNAHDLERVLAHYADDVELVSPRARQVVPESGGVIRGKAAPRAYWTQSMADGRRHARDPCRPAPGRCRARGLSRRPAPRGAPAAPGGVGRVGRVRGRRAGLTSAQVAGTGAGTGGAAGAAAAAAAAAPAIIERRGR
jgi:hypothetical protein